MAAALQSVAGLFVFIAAAWALSEDRRRFPWATVVIGLVLQLALALVLLRAPGAREAFIALNQAFLAIDRATVAGTSLVFGYLGGGPLPFEESFPGGAFVLAFRALPIVMVMSALSALLFHWRALPWVVRGFAVALGRLFAISGAAGFSAAANVFVGMVEAPLLVRPYLKGMSRSELLLTMTVGMATIAGTVLVLYAGVLAPRLEGALGHLLAASLISAPAAILIAQVMIPPEGPAAGREPVEITPKERVGVASSFDALTRGTMDGLQLLLGIIAMLLVFVALVSLVNQIIGVLPEIAGAPLTLERIFGWAFAPAAFLMGIPWAEAEAAGALLGVKTVLNEFLAYLQLAGAAGETLSDRSRLIMTYALCGFANFGSLGIMLGGLTAMAPERREEILSLGLRSLLSGTLATLMTGAVIGVIA